MISYGTPPVCWSSASSARGRRSALLYVLTTTVSSGVIGRPFAREGPQAAFVLPAQARCGRATRIRRRIRDTREDGPPRSVLRARRHVRADEANETSAREIPDRGIEAHRPRTAPVRDRA